MMLHLRYVNVTRMQQKVYYDIQNYKTILKTIQVACEPSFI